MRSIDLQISMPRPFDLTDRVFGLLGDVVIRLVLGSARLWTRLTRGTWHG